MNIEQVEARFQELCNTPSDINQHLPKLREYADKCEHITEMGVRAAVSLYAFLSSKAYKVIAYDIVDGYKPPEIGKLTFICADVLKIEIAQTDLLFIDTAHNYNQLSQELKLHAGKVNKYIAFHDTYTFGLNGDDGGRGLMPAIYEFVEKNTEWKICYQTIANNGLLILEK